MLILFRLESEGRARKERMNGHGTFQYVSFNFVRDLTRQELPLGVRPLPNQIRPSSKSIHIRSSTTRPFSKSRPILKRKKIEEKMR